jgi:hypothetical protein
LTLQVLRALAANLGTDASGDALVDYIYNDAGHAQGARDFVDRYTDPVVRGCVFAGTTVNGGLVALGASASCLKSALQRRYARGRTKEDQIEVFKPSTAYHITSSRTVMKSILSTGFRAGDGTAGGYGSYFYSDRQKAEDYVPAGGRRPRGAVVIEVTIFSNIQKAANYNEQYGGGTWANNFMGAIVAVKNPLLIFPKAVFAPGG